MGGEQVFRLAFWLEFGLLLLIRAISAWRVSRAGESIMPDRKAIEREGWGFFAARLLAFLFLVGLLVLYALDSPLMAALSFPLPSLLRWVGVVLGFSSLVLWAWAQSALGKQWSTNLQLRKKHRLITTGPYAWIRHPIYTAMLGWGCGVSLITANWTFVLLTLLMIAGLFIRVPKEEQMMIKEFGKGYKKYMQKTGRFVPKLG